MPIMRGMRCQLHVAKLNAHDFQLPDSKIHLPDHSDAELATVMTMNDACFRQMTSMVMQLVKIDLFDTTSEYGKGIFVIRHFPAHYCG